MSYTEKVIETYPDGSPALSEIIIVDDTPKPAKYAWESDVPFTTIADLFMENIMPSEKRKAETFREQRGYKPLKKEKWKAGQTIRASKEQHDLIDYY